jgi:hypothetical protein
MHQIAFQFSKIFGGNTPDPGGWGLRPRPPEREGEDGERRTGTRGEDGEREGEGEGGGGAGRGGKERGREERGGEGRDMRGEGGCLAHPLFACFRRL